MTVMRRIGAAAVSRAAASAGTMASSSGSAMVAPRPRRTVRRGRCLPVMIMFGLPHLERHALDDSSDDRGPAFVARGIADDLPDRRAIVVVGAPAQRVGEKTLRQRRDELVAPAHEHLAELPRPIERRPIGEGARGI